MGKQAFNLENDMNERSKEDKNFIIKNTIFGQLLSITHNMLAFEVDKNIVKDLVIKFGKSLDPIQVEQINDHIGSFDYPEKILSTKFVNDKDCIQAKECKCDLETNIELNKTEIKQDNKIDSKIDNKDENSINKEISLENINFNNKPSQNIESQSLIKNEETKENNADSNNNDYDDDYVMIDKRSSNILAFTDPLPNNRKESKDYNTKEK